jgi:TolB-like protein/Tfp pilus assembly protein PilF
MRFLFGDCTLDRTGRELHRHSEAVHVEPQVFDLILFLIENRDRIMSKDELLSVIWQGRIVSESTLNSRINAARRAIGDSGGRQDFIRTIARRGFRFVGEVAEQEARNSGVQPPPRGNGETGLAETELAETGAPKRPSGHKPVVAVMPCANLSGDPDEEYLCDGFTEDIITALARHRSLFVIARNSVFAFKEHGGDVRDVGAKLGADYIVEGSIRRRGGKIRVTAHLIETGTGQLLWTDRYDEHLEALFEVQDAITNMIVASIETEIGTAERSRLVRRAPVSLRAWDLFQLGTRHLYKSTRQDNLDAQRLLRLAIDNDDRLASAHAYLSYAILLSMLYFDAEPEESRLDEVLTFARRAMEIDDRDAQIRFVYGRALLARRSYVDALDELEQAAELNPALAVSHCGIGDSLAYEGRYEEAFRHFARAIELGAHDPQRWAFLAYRAMAHLFARQFRLAADWAQKATRVPNCHYWPFSHRVSALGHLGATDELRAAVQALLDRKPGFNCQAARQRLFYIKNPEQIDIYLEGLRKAGIPETPQSTSQ